MRVKAINTERKVIYGIGFCPSDEPDFDGHNVSILFKDTVEWRDGSELGCTNFDFVFTDSIELIEEDSSLHYDYEKYLG